ncbi:hypothetical protein G7054_g12163 [Neopestalotiopsis clavispora]|nr:hypothetical protein G7054_g12163 [Neopestalotiopsis clavispora]
MSTPDPNNEPIEQALQPMLNGARRPQRLYLKVQNAMKVVNKILDNGQFTGIKNFLGDAEFAVFRRAVREIIRTSFDANIDSWPTRVVHNYDPDARTAILRAVEEQAQLFVVADGGDEFVPCELIYPAFYNGPW